MKEEGSYEDSGCAETHIVAILNRSPKNAVRFFNDQEKSKIIDSAKYNSSSWDFDSDDEKQMRRCLINFLKRIK